MDPWLLITALVIGVVVGMTGMGGGALVTPVLVIFFGVPPLAAVSSDLVASAVMKPAGSVVHMRQGTVNWRLVLWLVIGAVPAAFCGVLVIQAMGPIAGLATFVKTALGIALLMSAAGLFVRAYVSLRKRATTSNDGGQGSSGTVDVPVRVVPTLIVGVVGGLMVGMTSVGSGSLIIIGLMALYPALTAGRIVGTDLVQSVPLVFAAAIGHIFFGDVDWSVVLPLVLGSVPGVIVGSRLASKLPSGIVRRALAVILLATGLTMVGVPLVPTLVVVAIALVAGTVVWMLLRTRFGLPPLARQEKRGQEH